LSCNSAASSTVDDALVVGNEPGEAVEHGGLSGAGAACEIRMFSLALTMPFKTSANVRLVMA
jgi:hypothetical protein